MSRFVYGLLNNVERMVLAILLAFVITDKSGCFTPEPSWPPPVKWLKDGQLEERCRVDGTCAGRLRCLDRGCDGYKCIP